MKEVADIVRLHGEAYRQKFRHLLTSAQQQALFDIQHCRTPYFGGHVHQCGHCGKEVYSYHSCRNRSCPKCHHDQTERWLDRQRDRLPSCRYYLLTFTLPAELHAIARSHPKDLYSLMMRAAADALQKLAGDPRYLGARVGALAVLHTWTRAMLFHPHVHMLVTAGGVSAGATSRAHRSTARAQTGLESIVDCRMMICDWSVIGDLGLLIAGRSGAAPASNGKSPIIIQQGISHRRSDNQQ